jgi:pSer/pThr/pTyr-binding forkhead associated (FHA) protein
LSGAVASSPPANAAPAPVRASAPAQRASPQAAPAVVRAPVVKIAPVASEPQRPRIVCARCRGTNSAEMSYCQFCGARLGEASVSQAPAPATPAMLAPIPVATPVVAPAPVATSSLAKTGQLYPSEAGVRARLVVIAQDGTPGRHYQLTGAETDIGRTEGGIVLPNDPYISPRHARLARRQDRFFLRDLSSLNGVYVRLRDPIRLETGDLVLIGLEVLRFELVTDAEKALAPAADRGTHIFGSPAFPRYARLCQRTVEGANRDIFYLSRTETILGREAGDIVFTSDPYMSRRHAALTRNDQDHTFTLRDLGSSNGTYVAVRGEAEVREQDHVRIGQHLFRLEVESNGRN